MSVCFSCIYMFENKSDREEGNFHPLNSDACNYQSWPGQEQLCSGLPGGWHTFDIPAMICFLADTLAGSWVRFGMSTLLGYSDIQISGLSHETTIPISALSFLLLSMCNHYIFKNNYILKRPY